MSLAEDPQLAGVHGRVAELYATADEARMRELDAAIAAGGRFEVDRKLCPCGCLEPLGACATKQPRSARPEPKVKTFTPAPPAPTPAEPEAPEETPMPCGNCGSKDHNRRTCTKATPETKAAPAKAPKPPPVPKPARGMRVAVRVEEVDDLLSRRDELLAELDQVEQRIRAAVKAKEDELERLRAAVQAATARAAAASKAA